jgi:hypothetical protein
MSFPLYQKIKRFEERVDSEKIILYKWATIVQIIPRRIPPTHSQRQECPQHQHGNHPQAQAQEQERVRAQHPSAFSTCPDQARRFRARASGGTTWRDLFVFLRLWGCETRSALHHRSDAGFPLLADTTFDGTMPQRTAGHGTVGRFEHRHLRSPS